MNKLTKIILTIPALIGLIYMITFWSIDFFRWITNNIVPFEYQNLVVSIIFYPALIFLIYSLWSYKKVDKENKWKWTFILIFFGIIAMPIYVWKTDDDLREKNKKNTLHNKDLN